MSAKKFSLQENGVDVCSSSSHTYGCSLPPPQLSTTSVRNIAVECSVCMEEFSDSGPSVPRSLACGHSFCTGCLERLLVASPNYSGVACPKCCALTPLSKHSVELVPKNFGVLEILACPRHTAVPDGSPSRRISPSRCADGAYCVEHGDHLSSYCITDKQLVCSSCLLYGAHKQHDCLLVNEAASQRRSILNSLTPDLEKHKATLEAALLDIDRLNEQIQDSAGRLIDIVNKKFDELAHCIEARRLKLKIEIMERAQIRVNALVDQSEKLREFISKTSIASASCAELVSASDLDILREFELVDAKIEAAYASPVSTAPIAYDDLVCTFSPEVEDEVVGSVERFGAISAEVGTVQNVVCQSYHDGFRISWEGHGFVDNEGISYHLQLATDNEEFATIYRGGETKFTHKAELKCDTTYKFRVQVRTTEGVGLWSVPVEAVKASPAFHWHSQWRSLRIELSQDRLSAWWANNISQKYWATFACDKLLEMGVHYMEVEIIGLGKSKSVKKLAVGAIDCTKESVRTIDWQYGKEAIGTGPEMPGWAFHPISGVLNCSVGTTCLPVEGKPYSQIQVQAGDRIGMLVDMPAGKISFFCNGQDLGVAFENVVTTSLLPALSLRDKMEVKLRFPPPPYVQRAPKIIIHSGRASIAKS